MGWSAIKEEEEELVKSLLLKSSRQGAQLFLHKEKKYNNKIYLI
jgi:hypothetical protein